MKGNHIRAVLSPQAAQAIVNLRINTDWQTVLQWIAGCGDDWNQVAVMTDDADKRAVSAGMTRAMFALVAAIEHAPQALQQTKDIHNGRPS